MRHSVALVVTLFAISHATIVLPLVSAQGSLPDNWKSLPAAEFVTAVTPFYDLHAERVTGPVDDEAVRRRAAQLVSAVDLTNTNLSYHQLEWLHMLAYPKLNAAERDRFREGLLARRDDWTGKPYAELQAKYSLMRRSKISRSQRTAEGRRWAQDGGRFQDVDPLDMAQAAEYFFDPPTKSVRGSFTVRWEGRVTAPQAGAYRFHISTVNLNRFEEEHPMSQSASVAVDGQTVLSANADRWMSDSTPVNLDPNTPAVVRVDLAVNATSLPTSTLHAVLFWSGPGQPKALVPQSAVAPLEGEGQGFTATYRWTSDGQPQSVVQIDPTIDFSWATGAPTFGDRARRNAVAAQLWQAAMDPEFLTACETGGDAKKHPFLEFHTVAASLLTSAQRRAFFQALITRPRLLDASDPQEFARFIGSFRAGADDLTLPVIGKWAERHADLAAAMPPEHPFEQRTRVYLWRLGIIVSQQMPTLQEGLQTQYLELPDGRCSLPTAYILSYAYLGEGRLSEWIEFLTARLREEALTGDKRVNWLLARAHAEEIRQSPPNYTVAPHARPLDGKAFLDEARNSAQSGAVKVRILGELLSRLLVTEQFQDAKALLTESMASLPEAQRAIASTWLAWTESQQADQAGSATRQATESKSAFLTTLRQRREEASKKGDTDAVSRYDALISAAASGQ